MSGSELGDSSRDEDPGTASDEASAGASGGGNRDSQLAGDHLGGLSTSFKLANEPVKCLRLE